MDQPYHSLPESLPLRDECREDVESLVDDPNELMFSCESLPQKHLEIIQKQIEELLKEVREIKKEIHRAETRKSYCTTM